MEDCVRQPTVGRKKKGDQEGRKAIAVTLKGSEAWKAWLERAADHQRTTVAEFLDRAAIVYAKQIGYDEEAPKR